MAWWKQKKPLKEPEELSFPKLDSPSYKAGSMADAYYAKALQEANDRVYGPQGGGGGASATIDPAHWKDLAIKNLQNIFDDPEEASEVGEPHAELPVYEPELDDECGKIIDV